MHDGGAPHQCQRVTSVFFDQQVGSAQWGGILFDPKNMSNRSPGLPETLVMLHSLASMPDGKFQTPKLGSHRFQLRLQFHNLPHRKVSRGR